MQLQSRSMSVQGHLHGFPSVTQLNNQAQWKIRARKDNENWNTEMENNKKIPIRSHWEQEEQNYTSGTLLLMFVSEQNIITQFPTRPLNRSEQFTSLPSLVYTFSQEHTHTHTLPPAQ